MQPHDYSGGRKFRDIVRRFGAAEHEAGLHRVGAEALLQGKGLAESARAFEEAAIAAEKAMLDVLAELERLQAEDPGTPGPNDDVALAYRRDQYGERAARVERLEKVIAEDPDGFAAQAQRALLKDLKIELAELAIEIRAREAKFATEGPGVWGRQLFGG